MSEHRFNLSALAVRERSITLFLIFLIAAAGILAFFQLGRDRLRQRRQIVLLVQARPAVVGVHLHGRGRDALALCNRHSGGHGVGAIQLLGGAPPERARIRRNDRRAAGPCRAGAALVVRAVRPAATASH